MGEDEGESRKGLTFSKVSQNWEEVLGMVSQICGLKRHLFIFALETDQGATILWRFLQRRVLTIVQYQACL